MSYSCDSYVFWQMGREYVLVESLALSVQMSSFDMQRWKRVEPAFRAARIVETEFWENRHRFIAGMRRLSRCHVIHNEWIRDEGWLDWIRETALTDWMAQLHLYEVEVRFIPVAIPTRPETAPEEYTPASLEWIEIALVDQLGRPAAHIDYLVKTSDGHTRRGRTGATGIARVSDIPAGSCEFTLPHTDSRAWEADGAESTGASSKNQSFQPLPKIHRAGPRDTLYSIAYMAGHMPETIWEHADNSALRDARVDMAVLRMEDHVVVPPIDVRTETLPTLQRHQFRLLNTHAPLKVELWDDEAALASTAIELYVDGVLDEAVTETDGDGVLETLVHVRAGKVVVVVDDDETYVLSVGALDPAEAARGVQQRLHNLGFEVGDADDLAGPQTWASVKRFQAEAGLSETGDLDQDTIDALLDAHGS